jgi:hypothetical protein
MEMTAVEQVRASKAVGAVTFLLCFGLLFVLAASLRTGNYAYGCDSFGYLRQAELFRTKGLVQGLDTRLPNEEARFLIDTARSTGIVPQRWGEMVAPHCHHYEPRTDRVILQYPPGSGLLLSLFPADRDAQILHIVVVGLVVVAFGLCSNWTLALLQALLLTCLVLLHPQVMASYSVPASIGLVPIAALLVLRAFPGTEPPDRPAAALLGALCGLLVTVRIPNILVVAGVGTFVLVQTRLWTAGGWRCAWPALGLGAVAFIILLSPLLGANWINAGGILASTYSAADAAPMVVRADLIIQNAIFYFRESFAWPLAIGAVLALAVCLARGRYAVAAGAGAALLLTLGYFLTHEIRGSYYLLPGALFCTCLCIFGLFDPVQRPRWIPASVTVIAVALVSLKVTAAPGASYKLSAPPEVLHPQSIVWADLSGGSMVFYMGKYTAKLAFADACTQDHLIGAVARAGRTQYFIADSPQMTGVIARLAGLGLLDPAGFFNAHEPLAVHRLREGAQVPLRC